MVGNKTLTSTEPQTPGTWCKVSFNGR